jgi:hypothetical protein
MSTCPPDHLAVHIKLVLKQRDQTIGIPFLQFDDEVDIPCHTWDGIAVGSH